MCRYQPRPDGSKKQSNAENYLKLVFACQCDSLDIYCAELMLCCFLCGFLGISEVFSELGGGYIGVLFEEFAKMTFIAYTD